MDEVNGRAMPWAAVPLVIFLVLLSGCPAKQTPPPATSDQVGVGSCAARVARARAVLNKVDLSRAGLEREGPIVVAAGRPTKPPILVHLGTSGVLLIGHAYKEPDLFERALVLYEDYNLFNNHTRGPKEETPLGLSFAPELPAEDALPLLEGAASLAVQVVLVTRYPAPLPPFEPAPGTAAAEQLQALRAMPEPKRGQATADASIAHLYDCPDYERMMTDLVMQNKLTMYSSATLQASLRVLPDALLACDCAADVEALVALELLPLASTKGVRVLPLPPAAVVAEVVAARPHITMQQFVDHAMAEPALAKKLGWDAFREEHARIRRSAQPENR